MIPIEQNIYQLRKQRNNPKKPHPICMLILYYKLPQHHSLQIGNMDLMGGLFNEQRTGCRIESRDRWSMAQCLSGDQ